MRTRRSCSFTNRFKISPSHKRFILRKSRRYPAKLECPKWVDAACTCRKARPRRTDPPPGVAMATAIVSVMAGIPVRRDLAMTGKITLRGRVWPIVGLKEKLLAALRGGIKTVLIPEENAKDLVEIAGSIKSGLEIVPVCVPRTPSLLIT